MLRKNGVRLTQLKRSQRILMRIAKDKLSKLFDEFLDAENEDVEIQGLRFTPSDVLHAVDMNHYLEEFAEWLEDQGYTQDEVDKNIYKRMDV